MVYAGKHVFYSVLWLTLKKRILKTRIRFLKFDSENVKVLTSRHRSCRNYIFL